MIACGPVQMSGASGRYRNQRFRRSKGVRVVRGRIELPTFRFSGLGTTVHTGVHDRPSALLSNDHRQALDVGERG